jgi:hypothetical protein
VPILSKILPLVEYVESVHICPIQATTFRCQQNSDEISREAEYTHADAKDDLEQAVEVHEERVPKSERDGKGVMGFGGVGSVPSLE